ncbi:hypothetical protein B0A52_05440 [Exophiala mesophila]|uniref:Apple domain-containing protein n=1 Tax=Exophiala mesophila TaxID=212818 RepID=A0A438N4Y4_EXOME|nr:hypothetical protein B0A52_05440 [Exophiala mesophila]
MAALAILADATPSVSDLPLNTLSKRDNSWTACNPQNPDNPYETSNGKKFYYNCEWTYSTRPSGYITDYIGRSFRLCMDDCSHTENCKGILWEERTKSCWLFRDITKQPGRELSYSDLNQGTDSAILCGYASSGC